MTKIRRFALAAVLVLAGCSDAPDSGVVVSKEYHPPYSWVQMMCSSYNPKTGACMTWMPFTHHVDERWVLCLRADGDEGCRDVSRTTYDEFLVGEYYPGEAR